MATVPTSERIVIIAMDGSEHSEFALNFFKKNIYLTTDKVILVHVPEFHKIAHSGHMIVADSEAMNELCKEEDSRVKKAIDKIKDMMERSGVMGELKITGGKPGEAIVHAAEEENANLIVTGTRGLGTIRRTFVGSVSDYILHHSHIPVLVCRHKN